MSEGKQTVATTFDFSDFVAERTRDFTGRDWLFAEIDQWLAQEDGPPVFILTGEPGIGKSAVAARLIQTRPVAAHHFCIARRADTLDPSLFVRSLSAQLSELEGFSNAIIHEADVHVDVRQQAERIEGEMVGVKIGNLVLNAPSAAAAFNRAIVAPLRAMADRHEGAPVLIVVDGLDEALQFPGRENIVRLLAGVVWPPTVRLLLTARPETGVLDHFEQARVPVRLLDAGQKENMNDARRHVRERVQASEALQARLAEADVTVEAFAARAAEAGAGNFLYLSGLLPAVEKGEQSPRAEAAFPDGLDGVYRRFLRARALDGKRHIWRTLYRPVLGVLAAAEEPLSVEQVVRFTGLPTQDTSDALLDVGQFLEPAAREEGRYQLYHQSLIDFLASRERAGSFWIDLPAVHGQIADFYLEEVAPTWSEADGYGLRHLARHLQAAGQAEPLKELLLEYRWLQAKLTATNVTALLSDFELLEEREESLQLLYEALRLSAHVLARDPVQLPSQLWGRLGERPEKMLSDLLTQVAESQAKPWLRPLRSTLESPGGSLVRTIKGHRDSVVAVAVTSDGSRAISGSGDGTLKVWDLKSGRELRTLAGHGDVVTAVAVTSDGRQALSASEDGMLKVWDLESGRELRTMAGHRGAAMAVAVTPDGTCAVSGSGDGTLKVWELNSGLELRALVGHTNGVWAVAVTPDGRRAVSASEDETLKVWDLATGQEVRRMAGHGGAVMGVAVTREGRLAVSASEDGTLKVWDLESGRELRTLAGHDSSVSAVAVTPDGYHVVSASFDGTLKVWDLENGRELRTLVGHGDHIWAVAVTPDGDHAVSASFYGTLKVWYLKSGRELRPSSEHDSLVTAVVVTPEGQLAVSASEDGTLKVWDLKSGPKLRALLGHGDLVWDVAVTPEGRLAVSASRDGTLKLWDLERGRELQTLVGHHGSVTAVAVTPEGHRAVSASFDDTLRVWDLESGRALRRLAWHGGWINAAVVTPDGQRAVSASEDGTLKVWDLESGREVWTLAGHDDAVMAVAVTPDSRRAVSASEDEMLKVWDLESGQEIVTLAGHSDRVTAVATTPDGQHAVSASWDKTLKVWNLESGHEVWTLAEHDGGINTLEVTPDGRWAVSASNDWTVKVWDLESGTHAATFAGENVMRLCAVAPDGRTIVAGEEFGRVHFLRLEGIDRAEEGSSGWSE